MKIGRWISMMTMAAAMMLAGCSESINNGDGTDDGGLGNSGGNGSGNGGNSGLVIEDSLNKGTSIVGAWQQEEENTISNEYWIFRADGTCTRLYYSRLSSSNNREDSGIYQYENGKIVTSVIPSGSIPYVFNVLMATETQLVLENVYTNKNMVLMRITVDDEPTDNIWGYWIADYYKKQDIVVEQDSEYIVDLSQRSVMVKDNESGEIIQEYYIGYMSNKFLELLDKERNSSYLYRKNEEYNIEYGYPTATITEASCKLSGQYTSIVDKTTYYSYSANVTFNYTGFENVERAYVSFGGQDEDVRFYSNERDDEILYAYISRTTKKYSSFPISIYCYIKGCSSFSQRIELASISVSVSSES